MNDKMNLGGRPKKPLHKKQKYQVNIKMMTEDYFTLKALANEAAMTINDFVRAAILHTVVKQRLTPEVNNYIKLLCNESHNLNQITKKIHQIGYPDMRNEYLELADKIDKLINSIKNDSQNCSWK